MSSLEGNQRFGGRSDEADAVADEIDDAGREVRSEGDVDVDEDDEEEVEVTTKVS